MKNLRMIIFLIVSFIFTSCSQNLYVKNIERGYHKSKEDKTIYIKEDENYTYTKKKAKYTVYENQHFLVLKTDKKTGDKTLYLALKYRGDNWIYMKSLDLISNEVFHIDFMSRKMNSAFWRDKSNLVDSVEEYIAFALTPEEIEGIRNMVNSGHGNIKFYSELDGRTTTTKITEEEIKNMKDILKLY